MCQHQKRARHRRRGACCARPLYSSLYLTFLLCANTKNAPGIGGVGRAAHALCTPLYTLLFYYVPTPKTRQASAAWGVLRTPSVLLSIPYFFIMCQHQKRARHRRRGACCARPLYSSLYLTFLLC